MSQELVHAPVQAPAPEVAAEEEIAPPQQQTTRTQRTTATSTGAAPTPPPQQAVDEDAALRTILAATVGDRQMEALAAVPDANVRSLVAKLRTGNQLQPM